MWLRMAVWIWIVSSAAWRMGVRMGTNFLQSFDLITLARQVFISLIDC